ncbi:GNAT family N-acetyltransferase [Streptomyces sp. NPDC054834]
MTRALSTPPVIPSGFLAASPNPFFPPPGIYCYAPGNQPTHTFLSAYQDPEIRRWHARRRAIEIQVREQFATYRQDWEREKGCHWAITHDDGQALGRIALRGLDLDDGLVLQCGFVIYPVDSLAVRRR